jgi:hypothetical protein
MAISVVVNSAVKNPDGSVDVQYDPGGGGARFRSVEDMNLQINTGACLTTEWGVLLVFMAWWLARSPGATNTSLVVGKTMTVDLSAANAIRVQ